MTNFDRFIDRTVPHGPSGVEGLSGFDVARLIGPECRAGALDCGTLRDLGFDHGVR